MNIIAHRGLWGGSVLGNSLEALTAAFDQGFDVELDIRDCCGEVVIEHDPPTGNPLTLQRLFEHAETYDEPPRFYLNIKADGLAPLLAATKEKFPNCRFTTFDHSVPDLLRYTEMPFLLRHSEYESAQSLLSIGCPDGVWLDCFEGTRPARDAIREIREFWCGEIVVVSDELHGRDPRSQWLQLPLDDDKLSICTDRVREAVSQFG